MKSKSKVAGVLAVVVFLTGCATSPFKGYSGPDLPPEEVAIVTLTGDLVFVGVDDIKPSKPIRWGATVSMLPGRRIIKIGSTSSYRLQQKEGEWLVESVDLWLLTSEFGGYRVLDVNVEAGHIYSIESKFSRMGSGYIWTTTVFDSGNDKPVEARVYDGMFRTGSRLNPRRPYNRKTADMIHETMTECKAAFEAKDLDRLMALFSDNYVSSSGSSKVAMRENMAQQIVQELLDILEIKIENAYTTPFGDKVTFGPVEFTYGGDTLTIVCILQREDDKWLIVDSTRRGPRKHVLGPIWSDWTNTFFK